MDKTFLRPVFETLTMMKETMQGQLDPKLITAFIRFMGKNCA
jgi:HD-GYP domain-containing protein (c-di-GMP phosphodiesterase class II)